MNPLEIENCTFCGKELRQSNLFDLYKFKYCFSKDHFELIKILDVGSLEYQYSSFLAGEQDSILESNSKILLIIETNTENPKDIFNQTEEYICNDIYRFDQFINNFNSLIFIYASFKEYDYFFNFSKYASIMSSSLDNYNLYYQSLNNHPLSKRINLPFSSLKKDNYKGILLLT